MAEGDTLHVLLLPHADRVMPASRARLASCSWICSPPRPPTPTRVTARTAQHRATCEDSRPGPIRVCRRQAVRATSSKRHERGPAPFSPATGRASARDANERATERAVQTTPHRCRPSPDTPLHQAKGRREEGRGGARTPAEGEPRSAARHGGESCCCSARAAMTAA